MCESMNYEKGGKINNIPLFIALERKSFLEY